MDVNTASASASCGTAPGWTNEVTSIQPAPAAVSRSTKWILSAVEMRAGSFCNPSRGPTSTTRTSILRMLRGLEHEQAVARGDLLVHLHADRADSPRVRRLDDVLHLHRLQ